MLTAVMLPTNDLQRFFSIVKPFNDWLRMPHGIEIPSPLFVHLRWVLEENFEVILNRDALLRSAQCPSELEYHQFIAYLNTMLLVLSFEIEHYDLLTVPFFPDRPEKQDYLLAYIDLLAYRLDIRYKCINILIEKIRAPGLSKKAQQAMLLDVAQVFSSSDEDMATLQTQLKDEASYFKKNASPDALIFVYQSYLETRLYKHSIAELPSGKATPFQLNYILELAKAESAKANNPDAHLTLMHLEARVDYHFRGQVKKGIDGLLACMAYFEAHHSEFKGRYLEQLKVNFIMELVCFMSAKIIADKSLKNGPVVKRWLDVALQVKPVLDFATNDQRKQLLDKLLPGIEAYLLYLKRELGFVKLPDCQSLEVKVLGLAPYIHLVKAINAGLNDAKTVLWLGENEKELSELFKNTRIKSDEMKAKAERESERSAALEVKEAEYNASFEDILKQFQQTIKVKLKARKVVVQSPPALASLVGEQPEAPEEAVLVRELSVSEACVAYFQANPDGTGQAFLAMQSHENQPEAMLYIGDQAMVDGCVQDALEWYEQAIAAFDEQDGLNPLIRESIEMVLTLTREFLGKQLERAIQHQKALDSSLYNKIINWGLMACREAKCRPQVLAMKDDESVQMVYNAGWDEFLKRGEDNKQSGRGLSKAAKEKRRLKADQSMFRECIKKTDALMSQIKPAVLVGETATPSLHRSRHVTLYQPKPKLKAAQQAGARQKNRR